MGWALKLLWHRTQPPSAWRIPRPSAGRRCLSLSRSLCTDQMNLSLFERLMDVAEMVEYMLQTQSRTQESIADWPSRAFYTGMRQTGTNFVPPPQGFPWPESLSVTCWYLDILNWYAPNTHNQSSGHFLMLKEPHTHPAVENFGH